MMILYVGLGGFLGTVCRYLTSLILKSESGFPWSTLTVNVLGCFAISCLYFWSRQNSLSETWWLILTTGFLGGFTTFSAFGLESYKLLENQNYAWAMANVGANVCVSFVAMIIAKWIFS